jgi:Rod binding domain-containing protein
MTIDAMTKIQNLNKFETSDLKKRLENKSDLKVEDAKKVAKEFETLFVDMVLKKMRETSKPEDESNALHIFNSMLDTEYSKSVTDAENFGIRDMILEWMTQSDPELKDKLTQNAKVAHETYKKNS